MNYKQPIMIMITIAGFVSHVQARQEQELFLQAAQDYEAGNIVQAYAAYKSLPVKSAGTLYNMGNCAYRLHDYGQALGYWMQSLLQAPRFIYPWLFSSIQATQEKLELPIITTWQKTILYAQSYMPLLYLQLVTIILLSVALLGWLLKKIRSLYLLLLLVMASVTAGMSFLVYDTWYAPSVVVIKENVSMYTGPDDQFPVVQKIRLGMRAKVVGIQDSWYKISYFKNRGWIQQSYVMNIS